MRKWLIHRVGTHGSFVSDFKTQQEADDVFDCLKKQDFVLYLQLTTPDDKVIRQFVRFCPSVPFMEMSQ